MSKTKKDNAPVVSQEQFEQMMAEVETLKAKNAKQAAENARLKERLQVRPDGAMWLPNGTIYFPKGSRRDLIGQTIKVAVPPEAVGKLYLLGTVKESAVGVAVARLQGWLDTNKLALPAVGEGRSDEDKATESFQSQVVDA